MSEPQAMIKGIPAWNFELLVNVFEGDNYWDTSLQTDMPEAYEAITSIGKKYGDIAEYEEALEVYNKYEPQIIEYYGGKKAVDFIIEEFDTIPIGIIKPPKLKNKLKAKYIEGINYSTGKYYDPITPEQQMEWDKDRFGDEGNPAGTELPRVTRSLKRALRSTVIKKSTATSEVFFNTDIIAQIQNGNLKSIEESENLGNMSFAEHMKYYEQRHAPQFEKLTQDEIRRELLEENTKQRYSLVSEAPIPTDILLKKMMIKCGLNTILEERKAEMSRDELSRLARFLGAENVYDEKTMKKLIKKTEKRKNKDKARYDKEYKNHKASVSRALSDLISRSRLSKNDWEDD